MYKKFLTIYISIFVSCCNTIFAAPEYGFWLAPGNVDLVKDIEVRGIENGGQLLNQKFNILNVIKWGLNRLLGILGLVALIILLYGWFQMMTAMGDDKKFGAGQSYLKTAATALAYIALAWFIVSMLFFLLGYATR
jgi:Type IV secretion system pilin